MHVSDILKHAAGYVGGMAILTKELGISRTAPYQWQQVPVGRVLQIEALTGGRVSRHTMRPDLYPRD